MSQQDRLIYSYRLMEATMKTQKNKKRDVARLSTLDEFLEGEDKREEFEVVAIKEVRSWQATQTTKSKSI